MQNYHSVVWLDHLQAKIFFFDRDEMEKISLTTSLPHQQTHNKAGTIVGARATADKEFLEAIVRALEPAQEWLIIGPSTAKLELVKHVHARHPQLVHRIIGVESSDHPTDGQILAHARSYFRAADRMLP
jgi:stalled ribosome rescue protein Dom34